MTPNPKVKKIKLSAKEYHALRRRVYEDQNGLCLKCRRWFPFEEMSLHHYSRAVGDSYSNVDGFCLGCHPD